MRMKRVTVGRADVIHVETRLGIVNIHLGLTDTDGRRVERIEVLPDPPSVKWDGARLIEYKGRAVPPAGHEVSPMKMCKYHPDRPAIKEQMCGDCRVTYITTTIATKRLPR